MGLRLLMGVALAVMVMALDQGCQVQGSSPFGPQPHATSAAFFQGWYTRITLQPGADDAADAPTSLAFVLGFTSPPQAAGASAAASPSGPPALCLVLIQRGVANATGAVQSWPHYFSSLNITSPSTAGLKATSGAAAAAAAPAAAASAAQRQRQAGLNAALSSAATAAPVPGGAVGGGDGSGGVPTFTATTFGREVPSPDAPTDAAPEEQASSWCRLSVDAERLVLEARFPGALRLRVASTGNRSDALPWSPHSSSPEGWAGSLGPLVALHYATLTLGTPVNVTLEEEEAEQEQERPPGGAKEGAKEEGAGEKRVVVRERVVRRVERRLVGVAHSEGQWGRGFPPKWLWAQGHLVQPPTAAHAQAAPGSPAGPGTPWAASFVLAGGDLPHALSPPLPVLHQFLFSFRQADGLSVSVDPWSPPLPVWGVKEEADACRGTLALELGTLTHVVQVRLEAPSSSFTAVPCPTEDGFTPLSVESFAASATITVYQRGLVQRWCARLWTWTWRTWRHMTQVSVEDSAAAESLPIPARAAVVAMERTEEERRAGRRMGPVGEEAGVDGRFEDTLPERGLQSVAWWDVRTHFGRVLVAEARFVGVALEFGGAYRCDGGKGGGEQPDKVV